MILRTLAKTLVATVGLSVGLSAPVVAETLRIGIIAPLTGPGAPWGMAGKMAGEILANKVNSEGGLDVGGTKYEVEVIAYDDQYKAAEAVAAYNRLINQDGVKYIVIATSAPTMALKQNVEDDQIIALTSSYTPAAIDEGTKFMFRLYSTSADFMPGYVAWMKGNMTERKMVTLNPNDETGWAHTEVTVKYYEENGFEVLGSELYERSVKDFAPLLTKVVAMQPEVIDLGGSSRPGVLVGLRSSRLPAMTRPKGWSTSSMPIPGTRSTMNSWPNTARPSAKTRMRS